NDITEQRDGIEDFIANYKSNSTINVSIVTQKNTLDLDDLIPASHVKIIHQVENIYKNIPKATDYLVENNNNYIKNINEMQHEYDHSKK
ncbi:transcriptional antiterminator, partial [Staphylococcus aureus]|nr:transcriptional antiterminator [Staphylococcus aureus]